LGLFKIDTGAVLPGFDIKNKPKAASLALNAQLIVAPF
jgi:hypothetical protein